MALLSAAMSSESCFRLSRKSAPARAPRLSSSVSAEVDADAQTDALDGANAVFEMRKPLVRQTAEIDDVGAGSGHPERARNDRIDRQCRSLDDLGEDAHIVAREIDGARPPAEKSRQILQFVGSALEGAARIRSKARSDPRDNDRERSPATPRRDASAGER